MALGSEPSKGICVFELCCICLFLAVFSICLCRCSWGTFTHCLFPSESDWTHSSQPCCFPQWTLPSPPQTSSSVSLPHSLLVSYLNLFLPIAYLKSHALCQTSWDHPSSAASALLPVDCSFGGARASRQRLHLPLPAPHLISAEAPWPLTCCWLANHHAQHSALHIAGIQFDLHHQRGVHSGWDGLLESKGKAGVGDGGGFVKLGLLQDCGSVPGSRKSAEGVGF